MGAVDAFEETPHPSLTGSGTCCSAPRVGGGHDRSGVDRV